MDLELIKRCWREEAEALPPRLEEGPVAQMVTDRAADLQRRVRRRLQREAGYYVPMMAVVGASLLSGGTVDRSLAAVSLVLLLGTVMATLWRAQRRIENTAFDRSVREALMDLRSKVEAAGRAYLAVYVALFLLAAVALVGFVWWTQGTGRLLAGAVVLGVMAVMWAHRSGRAYVERMFRRYLVEVAECLRQIEEPM